jgi:hypothetical protein
MRLLHDVVSFKLHSDGMELHKKVCKTLYVNSLTINARTYEIQFPAWTEFWILMTTDHSNIQCNLFYWHELQEKK